MSTLATEPGGGRDPDADRNADHYGSGAGGKKRKVPHLARFVGRDLRETGPSPSQDGQELSESEDEEDADASAPKTYVPSTATLRSYRLAHSPAANACSFRRALFLRRKAAMITLFLDAQTVISNSAIGFKNSKRPAPALPDVTGFEKLLPALEDVGVNDWAPDRPGWRSSAELDPQPRLVRWRAGAKRRRLMQRPLVNRQGLAPEGSFEFEKECRASDLARNRARSTSALQRLATELRAVVLMSNRVSAPARHMPSVDPEEPDAVKRRVEPKIAPVPADLPSPASLSPKSADIKTPADSLDGTPMSKTTSKASSEDAPTETGKKKPKKKKRSELANQSNPHHMKNYRPSRAVSAMGDPFERYPHHEFLLSPPSMRVLSYVPRRKTAPLPGQPAPPPFVRPPEDAFICTFCETALFFSTDKSRKRAVRMLKAEAKRKERLKEKAKSVAEGKGGLKAFDSEYDDDDEDDECGDDDGCGLRCSCGRAIKAPKSEPKPPDKLNDPPGTLDT